MFINDDLFFIEYADSVSYCYEKQQFDAQDTSHILINLGNPLCLSLTEENICLPKYQFCMFIPENKNILKSSPGQKFIYLSLKYMKIKQIYTSFVLYDILSYKTKKEHCKVIE